MWFVGLVGLMWLYTLIRRVYHVRWFTRIINNMRNSAAVAEAHGNVLNKTRIESGIIDILNHVYAEPRGGGILHWLYSFDKVHPRVHTIAIKCGVILH
jgi:hypothetical protein